MCMSKKMSKNGTMYLLLWFLGFSIFCGFFLSKIFSIATEGQNSTTLTPRVQEIAADGEYVYTLDDRAKVICKYRNDGERIWCRDFASLGGTNSIFCDEEGNFCRLDLRWDIVYVYDTDGNIVSQYESTRSELISQGFLDDSPRTEISVSQNSQYQLNKKFIGNSVVTIQQDDKQNVIVVESVLNHLLEFLLKGIAVASLAFAVYNLLQFILLTVVPKTGDKTEDGSIRHKTGDG